MFRANQLIQPLCVRRRQGAVPRTAMNYVFDPELPFQAHVRRTQVRSGPMAFGAPNWVGICGPAQSGRSHMPFPHERRRSGQANFDVDDLALAPRAQRETTSLEQL